MLVNGIAVALNAPAALGLITQIVERDELQAVNALISPAVALEHMSGAIDWGFIAASFGSNCADSVGVFCQRCSHDDKFGDNRSIEKRVGKIVEFLIQTATGNDSDTRALTPLARLVLLSFGSMRDDA